MKEIPENAAEEKSIRLILEQLKCFKKRPQNTCRKKRFLKCSSSKWLMSLQ